MVHRTTVFRVLLECLKRVQAVDIPIYDTVAVTAWKCLSMAGLDAARVSGWGRLFGEPA